MPERQAASVLQDAAVESCGARDVMLPACWLFAGGEDDSDDWEEGDDDEEAVGTPLDDMDPFISFVEVLAGMQNSMPARYNALMTTADANVTAALPGISQHAAAIKAKKAAEQQAQ